MNSHSPVLDESPIDAAGVGHYHTMTGSLNWAIALGQHDIQHAISALSSWCNVAPHDLGLSMLFWGRSAYLRNHSCCNFTVQDLKSDLTHHDGPARSNCTSLVLPTVTCTPPVQQPPPPTTPTPVFATPFSPFTSPATLAFSPRVSFGC
jgi:hypothetical protein